MKAVVIPITSLRTVTTDAALRRFMAEIDELALKYAAELVPQTAHVRLIQEAGNAEDR